MLRYFIKRLLGMIPTLIIVAVCVFFFIHLLPGDPARLAAGPEADGGNDPPQSGSGPLDP